MKFDRYSSLNWHPFVFYLDTESCLIPVDIQNKNTKRFQIHNPSSYGYYFIDSVRDYSVYRKFENVKDLISSMISVTEEIFTLYSCVKTMSIVEREKGRKALKNTKQCETCQKPFTQKDYAVMDHCHYTGYFRRIVHNFCNLKMKQKNFIPVIAHNMMGYDEKTLIRDLGEIGIIAKNIENLICFDKKVVVDTYVDRKGKPREIHYKLKFIDSLKFLNSSLDNLSKNLPDKGRENFKHTLKHFDTADIQKGVFPYDYITSEKVLDECKLLPMSKFYSRLYEKPITKEEYEQAIKTFKILKCKSIR